MSLLDGYFVAPDGQDARVWIPNSNGISLVKSFYSTQTNGSCHSVNEGYVWRISATWVLSFCWVAYLHKVITIDKFTFSPMGVFYAFVMQRICITYLFIALSLQSVECCSPVVWYILGDARHNGDMFDQWKYGFRSYRGKVV